VSTHAFPRLARTIAVVCLALGVLASLALVVFETSALARAATTPSRATVAPDRIASASATRAKRSTSPQRLAAEGGAMLAFPPLSVEHRGGESASAPALTVVYLHGIHGRAENGCPWFREGAEQLGWLVCPNANAALPGGAFSWGGGVGEQREVVARAERAAARAGASGETVLVGFSQGSFVAVDLVNAHLGRYRGLVLFSADVAPEAAHLRAAGVSRVVLGAGALDASFAPLQRAAARLRGEGMPVRFLDLGRIGHTYQTTNAGALAEAIAWAGGA